MMCRNASLLNAQSSPSCNTTGNAYTVAAVVGPPVSEHPMRAYLSQYHTNIRSILQLPSFFTDNGY